MRSDSGSETKCQKGKEHSIQQFGFLSLALLTGKSSLVRDFSAAYVEID